MLDGREQRGPYEPSAVAGAPLPAGQLVATLRYAAGVEIGVMLEYLAAVYSLNPQAGRRPPSSAPTPAPPGPRCCGWRSPRCATSGCSTACSPSSTRPWRGAPFAPALGVATLLPGPVGQPRRPVQFRAADAGRARPTSSRSRRRRSPSTGCTSASWPRSIAAGQAAHAATIRSVMAEGADHYRTFRNVEEWLGRHARTPTCEPRHAAEGDPALVTCSSATRQVLDHLHRGYAAGLPAGGARLAAARLAMLGTERPRRGLRGPGPGRLPGPLRATGRSPLRPRRPAPVRDTAP